MLDFVWFNGGDKPAFFLAKVEEQKRVCSASYFLVTFSDGSTCRMDEIEAQLQIPVVLGKRSHGGSIVALERCAVLYQASGSSDWQNGSLSFNDQTGLYVKIEGHDSLMLVGKGDKVVVRDSVKCDLDASGAYSGTASPDAMAAPAALSVLPEVQAAPAFVKVEQPDNSRCEGEDCKEGAGQAGVAAAGPLDPSPASAEDENGGRSVAQVVKVKDEAMLGIDGPQMQERAKQRRKYQKEPGTEVGRQVFRSGCHGQCITKLLGGCGTHPYPVNRGPDVVVDGKVLIRKGEFYVKGRCDWNPWDPAWPGDAGLARYGQLADEYPDQEFQVFRQCSFHPSVLGYHGRSAKGGMLYCGVYKFDDGVVQIIKFTQLPLVTRRVIVKLRYRGYNNCPPERADQKYVKPHRLQTDGGDDWTDNAGHGALLRQYEAENEPYHLRAIIFVRYDEELYQALVKMKAGFDNNRARVSLVESELGPA